MKSSLGKKIGKIFDDLGIGLVIIAMMIVLSFASEYFFTLQNFLNILLQASISTVVAVGMTVVIITGGIDLAVGSIVAFCGIVVAMTLHLGFPVPVVIALSMIAAVVVGSALGGITGMLVVKGRVPAFIASLGMMSVARGAALFVTGGQTIHMLPEAYHSITGGRLWIIPIPILYAIVVVVIATVLLNYTKFGRYLYALGGNKEATRLSGLNTKLIEFMAYVISGLTCGIGAILLVGRLNSGQPIAADGYELDAIAAAIIGGTSLSGGVGKIRGTVLGAILMQMLRNGLTLLNVSQFLQQIIIGAVIVFAVLFDMFRSRMRKKVAVTEKQPTV